MSTDWTDDDIADWHRVATVDDIRALPPDARKIFVAVFDDAKARALVERVPEITSIQTDGNNGVTDAGVQDLARLLELKDLDLEWSAVTDAALRWIAQMAALEWVDLGFTAVTPAAVAELQASRPTLRIDYSPRPLVGG